jgi:hypothetical protein
MTLVTLPLYRSVGVTDGKHKEEHTLEWIAAGLVALFVFAGVAFYSFSVDVRSVSTPPPSNGWKGRDPSPLARRMLGQRDTS